MVIGIVYLVFETNEQGFVAIDKTKTSRYA